jgi:hypothetical protein
LGLIGRIPSAAEDLGKELEEKTSRSNFKRVVFANEDKQEILRLIREINFAIEFAVVRFVFRKS